MKEASLAPVLLNAILRYWPFANSDKEKLFLTELREVVEVIEPSLVQPIVK